MSWIGVDRSAPAVASITNCLPSGLATVFRDRESLEAELALERR